ncbi:unnamed protein product [Porites evermanni]|uniref:Uncharacterized protein n=1 Tax=Porites evermanni TaxID=104178 RepID=A0ABN8RPK3_9CNID|nr:unnamed protein product [Porites evermanni]
MTTWYRPPDSKVEIFYKFESYLLKLDQEDKESIIMDQPTRIASSPTTLIDHIFTNKPNIITNHGVLHVGISDHSLIYATHKHNTLKADPKIIESRQFENFDCDAFIEDIKETSFHFSSLMDDPNEIIKKHIGNLKETWNVVNWHLVFLILLLNQRIFWLRCLKYSIIIVRRTFGSSFIEPLKFMTII